MSENQAGARRRKRRKTAQGNAKLGSLVALAARMPMRAAVGAFGFAQKNTRLTFGVVAMGVVCLLASQGLTGRAVCDLTLRALLVRYRLTVVPLKRSADREAYMLGTLERASFAASPADRVTSADVKSHRDARLGSVGPASVVRELGLLQHAYEVARTDWGFEGLVNPVKGVARPKLPSGRARRLSDAEEARLVLGAARSRARSVDSWTPHL